MPGYVPIFLIAFLLSLFTVPLLVKWARRADVYDATGGHKIHAGKVPRLGGMAIFFAFTLALTLFSEVPPVIWGLLAGASIVFVTGLLDDLFTLTPKEKFLGEILATLTTISMSKLYITDLGDLFGFGNITLPLGLAIPFTVFAVVGVINAINLIDGLDGLSGGISVIALITLFLLGYHDGNGEVPLICAALIGATSGFLVFNAHPARIFMGDAGSLLLGFVLAFLSIHLTQAHGANVRPVAPLLILGLPIVDAVFVMTRRLLKGSSPFRADKTHIHHQFLYLGLNHMQAVYFMYGISFFWASVSLWLRNIPDWNLLLLFSVIVMSSYVLMRYMHSFKKMWQKNRVDFLD